MSFIVKFDPGTASQQARIIPDASPTQDGVMTKAQAAKLAALDLENLQVCHLSGTCATPTFVPGAGSGANPTVEIEGTDLAGYIRITPTEAGIGGDIGKLVYTTPYVGETPVVVFTPANDDARTSDAFMNKEHANTDQNSFQISAPGPLSGEGDYIWAYHVIGRPNIG